MTRQQRAILEAGEEDEDKKEEEQILSDEPFAGLDLRFARCFGFNSKKDLSWKSIASQADDVGWELIDKKALEKSLAKDVEQSYFRLAEFTFVDVDDDTAYSLWFDNNKALWGLEIKDSPKAELSIEERADFFKSDMFKKTAKKAYYRLVAARDVFNSIVKPHLENAELMLVDTVKLDAIVHFLESEHLLDNLLNGKYLNY